MRRISFIPTVLIATVVAIVACSKENDNNEPAPTTHSINFVASQPETKTIMEIRDGKAYFDWEEADKANIHIYESGMEATALHASIDATTRKMSFSAEFPGNTAPAGATYNAHLNSDIRTQEPATTSYDGKCDVLSAKEITVTDRTAEISIIFEREVAVNKMTLKGLGKDEIISSVTLTSDKAISGVYAIDAWTEPSTTLSISPDGVVSDEDGTVVIYFTCLPVTDAQLTVEVMTTGKTYSKTFAKTISFEKGKVKSFGVTVEEDSSTGTEHEYVDLGLSVKWATMNVGATKIAEYGDYFAWGAIEPWYESGHAQDYPQEHWKSGKEGGYTWVNTPYQTENASGYPDTKWTKYVNSNHSSYWSGPGDPDNKKVLDLEDDAAYMNWGGNWRMPTNDDWSELRNESNCTWTWTSIDGIYGFKVQSNKPGYTDNWIFLPAAGFRDQAGRPSYIDSRCYYWSSTLSVSYSYQAIYVSLYYVNRKNTLIENGNSRYFGDSVRPVCP